MIKLLVSLKGKNVNTDFYISVDIKFKTSFEIIILSEATLNWERTQ